MTISPRILERTTNLIDLQIPWVPGITEYRLVGHSTLQGAWTAPDTILEVTAGTTFGSPSVLTRGHYHFEDDRNNTRATRIRFDLNDYSLPANNIPTDGFILYLRLQAYSQALGAFLPAGPIIPLPPAVAYGAFKLHLTLAGTAPVDATAVRGGPVVAGAMAIMFPGVADKVDIVNQGAAALFYAFEEGTSLAEMASGNRQDFDGGRIKYLFLVSATVGLDFSIFAAMRAD